MNKLTNINLSVSIVQVALGKVLVKDELEKKDKFDTRKVHGEKEPVGGLTIEGE